MRNKLIWCVFLIQLCIVIPGYAEVIPMQREEVIQRSKLIFVGAVLEKNAHWNDKGNLIVTDYVFRVDDVLFGNHADKTIELTLAGGQLPKEGQSVSDVPEFQVGEVVLVMVEDSATPLFSPVTGMYQGKFTAGEFPGAAKPIAFDGLNQPILTESGQPLGFDELVNLVRAEIPVAKSKPLPDRSPKPESQKFILQDLPAVPYDTSPAAKSPKVSAPESPDDSLEKSPTHEAPQYKSKGGEKSTSEKGDDQPLGLPPLEWSYSHRAKNVPIVFNPWPDSFPEWVRYHDQYQMSYWNSYANIYQVMAPTGGWAWQNDRYDMCGFPDNATMIAQFGAGWGATTLAITWSRWDSTGFSIEADIACNPAFSWSTDNYGVYYDPNVWPLDQTLTHELGHAWGLDHQFNFMSVMNYMQKKYRSYNRIQMDDSSAIQAAFPSNIVGETDLDIQLYYSSGYQNYLDSDLNTQNVSPGDSLTVSNITMENAGTVTLDPGVDWYLCPTINSWNVYYYIGSTTHATLSPGNWFLTSRTLTIPSGIPDGVYYLGAYVNNGDQYTSNNSSWLDRQILVTTPAGPPNDYWSDSYNIGALPAVVNATNFNATVESGEPDVGPAGATVWWHVQAPASGTMMIDTYGSDFDTMLHVYSGYQNGLPNLLLEAQNDDAGGTLQSEVAFPVVANEIYDIRVGGYNSASGNIVMNVSTDVPDPLDIPPSSVAVTRGLVASGGLEQLEFSDNVDLSIFRDPSSVSSITEFTVNATSPTNNPVRFDVTLEGSVFARSNVVQTIAIYDFDTSAFEVVSTENASRSPNPDLTVTATGTGDLSRFVGPNNEIQVRVKYHASANRAQFTSNTDQLYWTIQ